jgi:hypothetical protein
LPGRPARTKTVHRFAKKNKFELNASRLAHYPKDKFTHNVFCPKGMLAQVVQGKNPVCVVCVGLRLIKKASVVPAESVWFLTMYAESESSFYAFLGAAACCLA